MLRAWFVKCPLYFHKTLCLSLSSFLRSGKSRNLHTVWAEQSASALTVTLSCPRQGKAKECIQWLKSEASAAFPTVLQMPRVLCAEITSRLFDSIAEFAVEFLLPALIHHKTSRCEFLSQRMFAEANLAAFSPASIARISEREPRMGSSE